MVLFISGFEFRRLLRYTASAVCLTYFSRLDKFKGSIEKAVSHEQRRHDLFKLANLTKDISQTSDLNSTPVTRDRNYAIQKNLQVGK